MIARHARPAAVGVVLLVLSAAAEEPRSAMSVIVKDVDGLLVDVKTHVSRLDGCGPDQVGDECESATALSSGTQQPSHSQLVRDALSPDVKKAMANRGQLLFATSGDHGQPARPSFGTRGFRPKSGPCRSRNGKFPHKRNPRLYYKCTGGTFVVKKCDEGYVFDAKHQYCIPRSPPRSTSARPNSTSHSFSGRRLFPGRPSSRAKQAGHVGRDVSSFLSYVLYGAKTQQGGSRHSVRKRRRRKYSGIFGQILRRVVLGRISGWYCSVHPPGRSWQKQDATVEHCWAEALRRRARYLLLSRSGCLFRNAATSLTSAPCNGTAYHVVNVGYYRNDLQHLNKDMQAWISAQPPTGVAWGTVPGVPDKPLTIRGCTTVCHKFGQDFARIDRFGCRCGMAINRTAEIRQEDLSFVRAGRRRLEPGFTVRLHAGGLTGWECTAAPVDFVPVTGAQTLQEALDACRRRRFRFLAPGRDYFYCGNNTDNLERFSRTQCQMNVTTRRSYSVISINVIERQIQRVEEHVNEYLFWWVAEKAPAVFWTSMLDVPLLEQCVLGCNKRFVAIGPDGCSCGSLRRNHTSLHVREWVSTQSAAERIPGSGYLLLDKEGFVNVPEGWHCTTEPRQWKHHAVKRFSQCMKTCHRTKKAFAAFGKSGCRCGDTGSGFRRLPMARCQAQLAGADAYSVLSVSVWRENYANFSGQAGYRASWVAKKPAALEWELQPGSTVLQQCVSACNDQRGVRLISLGVNGCECGFAGASHRSSSLGWTLPSPNGRGFFLVERSSPSTGYTPPTFKWVVKANTTDTKHNISVSVEPVWIRLNITREETTRRRLVREGGRVNRSSGNVGKATDGPVRGVVADRQSGYTDERGADLRRFRRVNSTRQGATTNQEIAITNGTAQNVGITERKKEIVNNTERYYVAAGANAIAVGSSENKVVDVEEETSDRLSKRQYTKHSVKGTRIAQKVEQFVSNRNEQLMRGSSLVSDILQKDVFANQTHADSSAMNLLMKRANMKDNKVKSNSNGSSVALQIHIGGSCYMGTANRTKWIGPLMKPETPFACLCACVREKNNFYAVYENGRCFCANDYGLFGNKTGSITTSGRCPQPGARVIYNGIKHTHELAKFCNQPQRDNSIVSFLKKKDAAGTRFVDFTNSETLAARINSSSLKGSHVNRTDADIAKTVHRWHRKDGIISTHWRSHLASGPLKNLFSLRLHVLRLHNFTENLNLTTRQYVHTVHSARSLPFKKSVFGSFLFG